MKPSLPMTGVFLLLFVPLVPADTPPDPATLPPPPARLQAGFAAIDEAGLRAWVGFLASEELGGRGTGQPGYDVAARFCAMVLERNGIRPAGDGGTFFQDFDIIRNEVDSEASGLEVKDAGGADRFGIEELALRLPGPLEWTVPWAFAGFGEGPESDAPSDFRGIPLEERVVLILPRPGRKSNLAGGAIAAGAPRIAVISDEQVGRRSGFWPLERPALDPPRPLPPIPQVVYISQKAADRILRSKGLTVKGLLAEKERLPRFELAGIEVRLRIRRKDSKIRGRNVVGLLEGSDPARRAEAVAVGAHLDHMGRLGDRMYPGADDDASGSAGVLALARAFAGSPRRPARSILFLLFAAEEKGLWGSRYFVEHPAVPLNKITAELQLDMIGRNEERKGREKAEDNTNCVHLVGAEKCTRELKPLIISANSYIGLRFEYDLENVYRRSDQYNFGQRGVPLAFFTTGFHPDYHQPTDTSEKINYPKMARILRLVFAAAQELADRPEPIRRARRM